MEAGLQIIPLFLFLCCQEKYIWRLFMVGEGISIHDTHVVNTVSPSQTEVADKELPLLL